MQYALSAQKKPMNARQKEEAIDKRVYDYFHDAT